MGDKHGNKNKNKKQTTKEKKAENHLKLMQGQKDKHSSGVVTADLTFNKDKKAA